MTTTVHVYSSYLHAGKKLQIVRRHVPGNVEEVLTNAMHGHAIFTHHVWDGCELVIREVPSDPSVLEGFEEIATPSMTEE